MYQNSLTSREIQKIEQLYLFKYFRKIRLNINTCESKGYQSYCIGQKIVTSIDWE